MSRTRSWCFTLNNYTDEDLLRCKLVGEMSGTTYIVFGKEVGESGTPHLQGYVWFKSPRKLPAVKALIGERAHFEPRKGTHAQAADYCKKDGDFQEFGRAPNPGKRSDLASFAELVKSGAEESKLLDLYPGLMAKYPKFVDTCRNIQGNAKTLAELKQGYAESKLRPWQDIVITNLKKQGDRKVLWVVDPEGNAGKSWLTKYLYSTLNAFMCTGGKIADVAYAYNRQEYVVFDFTRSREEYVMYDVIESFKNGYLFSAKYNSVNKVFPHCKVVCFSNFWPDRSKLSKDRWDVHRIIGPTGMLMPAPGLDE